MKKARHSTWSTQAPQAKPETPAARLEQLAQRRLLAILRKAQGLGGLSKEVPCRERWQASVRLVGPVAMKRLNARFRAKAYATDVLSFAAPEIFQAQGWLGELVICRSVLVRQARERGYSEASELEILVVHGVLHLLGFDHESGPRQAALMARWEQKLLPQRLASTGGLIPRAKKGIGSP